VRVRLVAILCVCSPTALADIGIGAVVGDEDAAILVPIRFSSILVEPHLGYHSSDIEGPTTSPTSTDGYSVGVGLFGYRSAGENLTIHYGARLADFSEESSQNQNFNGTPLAKLETELDGYSVTPSVGFHYSIGRMMVGAEIGWQYSEADWKSSYTIFVPSGISSGSVPVTGVFAVGTALPGGTTESSTVSRGTVASIVFRYFFASN
jgi:hypothetical protein